jgi:hypothetical protein
MISKSGSNPTWAPVRSRSSSAISSARLESFSVGAVVARAINGAQGALGAIAETIRSDLTDCDAAAWQQGLDDFASHYTMQSERDVHERVTGVAVGARKQVPADSGHLENPRGEREELGDNVDFF